jgi:hypothetical protein
LRKKPPRKSQTPAIPPLAKLAAEPRSSHRHQTNPVQTYLNNHKKPATSISHNPAAAHSKLFPSSPEQTHDWPTDTMSTKIPSIAVTDTIGKHNEELLRDPATGLMPWETRLGRLMHRVEDAVRCVARKAPHVFFAAANQRMKKRR